VDYKIRELQGFGGARSATLLTFKESVSVEVRKTGTVIKVGGASRQLTLAKAAEAALRT
jgi:hypothetical protein